MGSLMMPSSMSTVLMMPFLPRMARQMIVREEGSRKNGMVSSVMMTALVIFDLQVLASQSAKGKAIRNSTTVIMSTTRSVRTAAIQRPESISEFQVLNPAS